MRSLLTFVSCTCALVIACSTRSSSDHPRSPDSIVATSLSVASDTHEPPPSDPEPIVVLWIDDTGKVDLKADCPFPHPSGCSDCGPIYKGNKCYWRCTCNNAYVYFDEHGNKIHELGPGIREVRPEEVAANQLIKATTASLEPVGRWLVRDEGTTRVVSGLAKSPTGQQYTLLFEVDGPANTPSVRSSRIYRQEVAVVMTQLAANAVK